MHPRLSAHSYTRSDAPLRHDRIGSLAWIRSVSGSELRIESDDRPAETCWHGGERPRVMCLALRWSHDGRHASSPGKVSRGTDHESPQASTPPVREEWNWAGNVRYRPAELVEPTSLQTQRHWPHGVPALVQRAPPVTLSSTAAQSNSPGGKRPRAGPSCRFARVRIHHDAIRWQGCWKCCAVGTPPSHPTQHSQQGCGAPAAASRCGQQW